MLELNRVQTAYGQCQVLFGIDLEVNDGEVVTLLWKNGMGKTTTIHSIMGMAKISTGVIRFNGSAIHYLPSHRIAKLGIGLVPEGRQIFPNLTVFENLVATEANRRKVNEPWNLERVCDLFPRLANRIHFMGNQLSGGEQQMLAIGRALMTNPLMLILDEATEGLAPKIRIEIWECLKNLKALGQSILLVDKNVQALTRFADRHYIIDQGRIVWSGDSSSLKDNEEIQHRYLGL